MDAPGRAAGSVDLYISWQGPKTYGRGLLEVGNLEIKGLNQNVEVYNLPDLRTDETKPLKFKVNDRGTIFSSECKSIKITEDMLKRIEIVAGILEPTPYRGPTIRNSRTFELESPSTSYRRTERRMPLEKTVNIEVGKSYTILCTHNGARLIPQVPPSPFDVLVDEVAEIQNRFVPPMMGWGVVLMQHLEKKADEVCEHTTHDDLLKMREASTNFKVETRDHKFALPTAKQILDAAITARKQQEDLFASICDSASTGMFKDAWDAIPGLEIDELNHKAFNFVIKRYYDETGPSEDEIIDDMVSKMPEGIQKIDVINYVYVQPIREMIQDDPAEAFLTWDSMPEGNLKNQLFAELKESQAVRHQEDLNISDLFVQEEARAPSVAPPVAAAPIASTPEEVAKEGSCVIS